MEFEVKIGIEHQTRCAGSCTGCVLTEEERKGFSFYDPDTRNAVRDIVRAHVDKFYARPGARRLGKDGRVKLNRDCAVHVTQADNLMLPENEVRSSIALLNETTEGGVEGFFTTSLVGSVDRVSQTVDVFHEESSRLGQPLAFLLNCDMAKIKHPKMREVYARNAESVRRHFRFEEAAVVVGPNIRDLGTPEEFSRYLVEDEYEQVEFALFPTAAKAPLFARRWRDVVGWVRDLLAVAADEPRYIISNVAMVNEIRQDTAQLTNEEFFEYLAGRVAGGVYVDKDGKVFYTYQGGIGDVAPITDRFGFESVGAVGEPWLTDMDAWERGGRRLAAAILADFARDRACAGCEYMRTCAASGFGLVRRTMRGLDGVADADCPVGMRGLIADLAKGLDLSDPRRAALYDRLSYAASEAGDGSP